MTSKKSFNIVTIVKPSPGLSRHSDSGRSLEPKENRYLQNILEAQMIKQTSWTKSQLMVGKRRRAKGNNRKIRNKEMSWSKTLIIVLKRRVKGDDGRNNCGDC